MKNLKSNIFCPLFKDVCASIYNNLLNNLLRSFKGRLRKSKEGLKTVRLLRKYKERRKAKDFSGCGRRPS